jgi:hypothetical protein
VTPPIVTVIDYIFESVSAKCELRLGNETITHIQTLSDWYGEGTAVDTAIKEMKLYAAERQIGPASELDVVVIRVAQQARMRPNPMEGSREPFRTIAYGSLYGLPEATETVVWSSRKPDAET